MGFRMTMNPPNCRKYFVFMYVCVCVRERERERQTDREMQGEILYFSGRGFIAF